MLGCDNLSGDVESSPPSRNARLVRIQEKGSGIKLIVLTRAVPAQTPVAARLVYYQSAASAESLLHQQRPKPKPITGKITKVDLKSGMFNSSAGCRTEVG